MLNTQNPKRDDEHEREQTPGEIPRALSGLELLTSMEEAGLIGMWADRDDIGDSSEFARKLRKRAETRQHE